MQTAAALDERHAADAPGRQQLHALARVEIVTVDVKHDVPMVAGGGVSTGE